MTSLDQRKVNKAIRDCLRSCEHTPHILAKIAGFLLVLRARGDWREAELRTVEAGVRRILYGILDGATYAGDATNKPASEAPLDGFKSFKVNGV